MSYLPKGPRPVIAAITLLCFPVFAHAENLNGANTAWILTSTALVLFMTIPGLSLFYAGLVRSKNVLSVVMQCFAITCGASLVWVVVGYSLAFTDGGGLNGIIGGTSQFMFATLTRGSLSGDIPESVFAMFQMTFAIITPALIVVLFLITSSINPRERQELALEGSTFHTIPYHTIPCCS